MSRHYIYRLEDKTTGEFYWGVRSCKNIDPKDDKYMGSMTSWKPNKKNLVKTDIIEYDTRDLANIAEKTVITYYINKNLFPLNRNYHTGSKFCNYGNNHSEETKLKMSLVKKGKPGTMLGKYLTEEQKKKCSLAKIGTTRPKEVGRKISESNKGRKHSEEAKKKISESNKGKKFSEETKKKMSEYKCSKETKKKMSLIKKGNTNLLGHKHSEEAKLKMSLAKKGKPNPNKGRKCSEETLKKMSLAKKSHPTSEETKRKISESLKRRKLLLINNQ